MSITTGTLPTLTVERLGCRLGRRWLIQEVSFDLEPGFTALVGPNGAGKSTLMRAIAGLIPVSSGSLSLTDGPPGKAVSRQIAYIPQFPGAYDHISVRDYLVRTAWWDRHRPLAQIQHEVNELLHQLQLDDIAHYRGRMLHPSLRRRVALASAWLRQVQVVFFDEPTAGLDPQERLAFWQQLYRLRSLPNSPVAYLISTHLLAEVQSYCNYVLLLSHGRIRQQSTVKDFVRTVQGHAYYACDPPNNSTLIDTGRYSREGYWVLAPQAAESLLPRHPDLIDAYLWELNQRFGDDSDTTSHLQSQEASAFSPGEKP